MGFRLTLLALAAAALACTRSPQPASRAAANASRLAGTLLEQLDGPPYSYLRLQTADGEAWAAVPAVPALDKSRPVSLAGCIQVRAFDAPAIGRRLDLVSFCTMAPGG